MKDRETKAVFDRMLDIMSILGMVMVAFMMLGISVHVIMRYIFGKPQNWVIDVSSILLFYITFLGAAWVLRAERHVVLDFLVHNLRPRHRYMLQIANSLLCSAVCAIIAVYGVIETITVWQFDLSLDMALGPPKWTVVILIPFGSILLFIQFIRRARGYIDKLKGLKGGASAA